MLIMKSDLDRKCLKARTVLLTGGGGGIGFEAARALIYLGANVIIAEIDKDKGTKAQKLINDEFQTDRLDFYQIDLSDGNQIDALHNYIKGKYGFLDAIINNATITPLGAVEEVSIFDWDNSYKVNLRAPILLTQKFLPDMKKYNKGAIVFVSSSGSAPYMGSYEVFKTAQVELCNTLAGELENTNIITYSISPGLVKTDTAAKGIEKVATLMGMSLTEFYKMNENHILDVEAAGTGFAVSLVNAERYNGQEIGSIQALMDAGIFEEGNKELIHNYSIETQTLIKTHVSNIVDTYIEQYNGWNKRNLFERQWVLRDFKKTVGFSAEQFKDKLLYIKELLEKNSFNQIVEFKPIFISLKEYYKRQHKLLQGYEKNPQRLKENSNIICSWVDELQLVIDAIDNGNT